ncbi:MAG: hypothetical protein C4326_15065 [Ignavibacteria bacterium]
MQRLSILDASTLQLVGSRHAKGEGPGEFNSATAWVAIRKENVYVYQKLRLSVFSLKGEYLKRDVRLVDRLLDASALFEARQSFGMDSAGFLYYLSGRRMAEFDLVKRSPSGAVTKRLARKQILPDIAPQRGDVGFGVHRNGSIVVTFGHKPLLATIGSDGKIVWTCDLQEQLPAEFASRLMRRCDEAVAKKLPYYWTNFWTDDHYTILTDAGPDEPLGIGKPEVYYVFIDSQTGVVSAVLFAQQNIVQRLSKDENDLPSQTLYAPFAIAHSHGYIYTYCYNLARLVKYNITWNPRK